MTTNEMTWAELEGRICSNLAIACVADYADYNLSEEYRIVRGLLKKQGIIEETFDKVMSQIQELVDGFEPDRLEECDDALFEEFVENIKRIEEYGDEELVKDMVDAVKSLIYGPDGQLSPLEKRINEIL